MAYIVGIDLPLPASFSGLSPAAVRKNTAFRNKLEKLIGHKIKLTGSSTANPNYKVKASFSNPQEAEDLAKILSVETQRAIDSGDLVYNHTLQPGDLGYVFSWNQPYPYWG